ncbi:MAG: bacillithiol biosynthesis cysteine-adding enzyme BshC [Acidobacteria bacterium]|nr:bacillithiol biosynthesis cysteine-adding enzyme BshC [Acidobacteriota bacterium]
MPAEPTSSSLPTSVAVDIASFPGIKRLAADYGSRYSAVAPFFAGDPSSDDAWNAIIATRQAAPHGDRIAEIVMAQQRARSAPAEASEAAARLADPQAVAIVTGQQAGLFGGPLYTILKAISAIRLARQVGARHGVPTVAVFWVDAEDHDLDEIRACHLLDADQNVATLALSLPPTSAGTPAATVQLGPDINDVLDALAAALPPTDFTDTLTASLRHAYAPGRRLVDAFAIWLEQLLGPLGLVVFDASDPAAKPLVAPLFERELNQPGVTASLARAAGERLEHAGFHAQVETQPESVALFLMTERRVPVRRDGDRFAIGDETVGQDELLRRLHDNPASLGPNVLLRPVVQDQLFPTVCYVAGPNELAYLAQLKDVYAHFDVPMPLTAPRITASLVDAAVIKFIRRHSVAVETLHRQDESVLNALLGAQFPETVDQALQATEAALRDHMRDLSVAVATVDPTLTGAAESTLGRMERDLQNFRNKVVQAAKRRDETLRRQFTRAQTQLFPSGTPQERRVASLSFLNRYGPALIDRLATDPTLDTAHHWVISV